jgi:hypothetical protein
MHEHGISMIERACFKSEEGQNDSFEEEHESFCKLKVLAYLTI